MSRLQKKSTTFSTVGINMHYILCVMSKREIIAWNIIPLNYIHGVKLHSTLTVFEIKQNYQMKWNEKKLNGNWFQQQQQQQHQQQQQQQQQQQTSV